MQDAISTVAIIGGGAAGWMAAAVLSKALGETVSITLVESEEIGAIGVGEATIPQLQLINRYLGFDENDFLKRTQGTFKLGIRFNDWTRLGDSYIHAFGDIGAPLGLAPFHHYWLRRRAEGEKDNLWSFSLNAQAAAQNKFMRIDRLGETPISGIRHAFHFDAGLYAKELRRHAEGRGVRRVEGKIVDVALNGENGFIDHVVMEDGGQIAADLFIDCSGFRALLIEGALKTGYHDWTHWLPCDRAIAVPSEHGDAFRPYTQSTAQKAGWQWRIPLQHRVGNGHVYCSNYLSEDEATAILLNNLEGKPLADPRPLRFTTGMRKKLWVRNCVAIGLSSGFMEPLESTSIHLIQSSISRLVSMFPDKHFDPVLIDEFNRQTAFEFERIRDFLILHYKAVGRDDASFWRDCAAMSIPDTLQAKIDLFRATGRIYREHEELFTEMGWLQIMIGQRIMPERYHPAADAINEDKLAGFMNDIQRVIDHTTARMPAHEEFVKQNCASGA